MKRIWKKIALALALSVLLSVAVFAGGDQPNLPKENEQQETAVQQESTPSEYAETETVTQTQKAEEEEKAPDMPCVHCESGTMSETERCDTEWFCVDYIRCQCEGGHAPMQDKVMERIVTVVMTCDSCRLSNIDTSTYTDTVHFR